MASFVPVACPDSPEAKAAAGGNIGGSVSIVAVWSGGNDPKSEEYAFRCVLKPFSDATGVAINYTSTRDINAVLTTGVASGNLPDVAGLPGPGQMAEFAKQGALKPLDGILDVPAYVADTPGARRRSAGRWQAVRASSSRRALKGLIWYNPKVHERRRPAETWADLQTTGPADLAAPGQATWCIGLESGAASGWPGTDWIEDIVLRQAGRRSTTAGSPARPSGPRPRSRPPSRPSATPSSRTRSAARRRSIDHELRRRRRTRCSPTPPGCLLHHQAQLHHRLLREGQGAQGRHRLRLLPVPGHQPASTPGSVDRRRRPVRHVQRHAAGQGADEVPRHRPRRRPSGSKLGGALSANKNVRRRYPDDISQAVGRGAVNAKIFALRRVRT